VFVLVVHRVTRPGAAAGNLAPLAIGLVLAATNLIAIPVDGASINPVRSFAPAVLSFIWPSAQWAIRESWAFWVAPIVGGLLASAVDRILSAKTGQ
jgi:aquaporin Z